MCEKNISELVEKVRDENVDVKIRLDSARVLEKMKIFNPVNLISEFIEIIKNSEDDHEKITVVRILANLRATEASSVLIPLLKSNDIKMLRYVSYALGQIKGDVEKSIYSLIPLMNHRSYIVRAHVTEAIVRLGGKNVVDVVIPLLQDSHPFVRSRIIHELGGHRVESSDIYLIPLLKDPDNNVRKEVEWALDRINTPDARRALRGNYEK